MGSKGIYVPREKSEVKEVTTLVKDQEGNKKN